MTTPTTEELKGQRNAALAQVADIERQLAAITVQDVIAAQAILSGNAAKKVANDIEAIAARQEGELGQQLTNVVTVLRAVPEYLDFAKGRLDALITPPAPPEGEGAEVPEEEAA